MASFNLLSVVFGLWLACTVSTGEVCPKENGFCVLPTGHDQNSGVIKLDSVDGNTIEQQTKCLLRCEAYRGATGCEVIWNQENRGCYVHTQPVARGNGVDRHVCWIFSKCTGSTVSTVPSTTPALSLENCLDMCQANSCQNDRNVRGGCSQMYSCAHGCKLRHLGLERSACSAHCDRNGQSGCEPEVYGWKFELCGKCNRGGCQKWPQVEECEQGCHFYSQGYVREGNYENHLYDGTSNKNNWHYVIIQRVGLNYKWINEAGVSWTLYPTADVNTLRVGPDSPYSDNGHTTAVFTDKGVFGPFNEFYNFEG